MAVGKRSGTPPSIRVALFFLGRGMPTSAFMPFLYGGIDLREKGHIPHPDTCWTVYMSIPMRDAGHLRDNAVE
eukprot:4838813-Pyramimonas_sp.AAC.1